MSDNEWKSHVKLINKDIAELAEFVSRHCELNKASESYVKTFAEHARNRNKAISGVKPYETDEPFECGVKAAKAAAESSFRSVAVKINPKPAFAMPLIHPFPEMRIAKSEFLLQQPRKIAEEACELIEAMADMPCIPNQRVEDEWADCVMALVNFAASANLVSKGKFDVRGAIERCEERQRERGRYED